MFSVKASPWISFWMESLGTVLEMVATSVVIDVTSDAVDAFNFELIATNALVPLLG